MDGLLSWSVFPFIELEKSSKLEVFSDFFICSHVARGTTAAVL